ncbi:MAG: DNA-binding protein [Acidobacteria bacterium]|nr:DNA-binding protein [Acidobacteriota bacterium]MDA1235964.1 DNA-binding protein [Acidobacteriota bacterium]
MRRIIAVLMLAALALPLYAQRSTREVANPTTEFDDSKPNSADVPDVYATSSEFQRVVILRFKHKADLLAGLAKAVTDEKIKNAVILSAVGSVRGYQIHSVSNRDFPSENIYVKDPTHPADLVSMNGLVMDGRVHAHLTLADEDHAFAGHLEPGTEVFTFAVVTLGILPDDLDLSKLTDKTYR